MEAQHPADNSNYVSNQTKNIKLINNQTKIVEKQEDKIKKVQKCLVAETEGQDYQLYKLSLSTFDELLQLQGSYKWQKYHTNPCQMFKMQIEGRIVIKGVAIVNYPFEEVVEFLDEEANLPKLNPNCIDSRCLYQKGNDIFRVIYMQFKAPWPVSNRDFVCVAAKKYDGQNKVYMSTKKCNYDFPVQKKVIRGDVIIGGYIIQRLGKASAKVTYISDTDIKGSIPETVRNSQAKAQGQVPSKIQSALKKNKK